MANSSFFLMYASEVLGIKQYLCPKALCDLRSIEGELPCKFLAVVFHTLSASQKNLLKKIMSSIGVYRFTTVQIKNPVVLKTLFHSERELAHFIFLFGGKNLITGNDMMETDHLNKKVSRILSLQDLRELEGTSRESRIKKRETWEKLKAKFGSV